jgi:hypothetical protein
MDEAHCYIPLLAPTATTGDAINSDNIYSNLSSIPSNISISNLTMYLSLIDILSERDILSEILTQIGIYVVRIICNNYFGLNSMSN